MSERQMESSAKWMGLRFSLNSSGFIIFIFIFYSEQLFSMEVVAIMIILMMIILHQAAGSGLLREVSVHC